MSLEMVVKGVVFDEGQKSPVVLLTDLAHTVTLPIYIGMVEATAIAVHLDKVDLGRPLTHDLLKTTIEALHGVVVRVHVTELKSGTYYANVVLSQRGRELRLDARPSDAIALAIRAAVPIFVDEEVIDESNLLIEDDAEKRDS